jgi:anti-anti-sigma factor
MSDHRKCDDLHVDDLHVKAKQDRTGTTIILEGEFDMNGTARFWRFFSEALAASPRSITLDAAGLTFIDSAGLMALHRACTAAGPSRGGVP